MARDRGFLAPMPCDRSLIRAARPVLVAVALAAAAHPAAAQPVLGPLGPPPAPEGNPVTESKALLGQALFWDEQLASTRSVACGTCHRPAAGGADPRTLADPGSIHPGADGVRGTGDDVRASRGVPANGADGLYAAVASFGVREQVTDRLSPPAIDAGYARELFWDGRSGEALVDPLSGALLLASGAALEAQVLSPPVSTVEMGHAERDWADVVARLAESGPLALAERIPQPLANWIAGRDYPALFEEAFGSPGIDPGRVAMAIASHERTLFSNQTPFDAVLAGTATLPPLEGAGRQVFADRGCNGCHAPPLLSDGIFHYTGVSPTDDDLGRFAVTGNPGDRGSQKTPSLRNVILRPPYMHDGSLATLEDVVDFYDRGGDFGAPNKAPGIVPLGLTAEEKSALVAFLANALTDPRVAAESGPFARPRLFSETERAIAVDDGGGVVGAGGLVPAVVAVEPPVAGNPSCTIAVDAALGGATATLVIDTDDPGAGPLVPASAALAVETIALAGAGPGAGTGSVALALPAAGELVDVPLVGRWYVDDPAAPDGVAVSPAFRFRIFRGAVPILFDDFESGDLREWTVPAG
jgi:cytochrome c peroxidase